VPTLATSEETSTEAVGTSVLLEHSHMYGWTHTALQIQFANQNLVEAGGCACVQAGDDAQRIMQCAVNPVSPFAVVIKGAQAICTCDRSTQLHAHTSITHIIDRFEQPQAALAA